ncbi:hypothetical protein ACFE04_007721 [Oxalis oulophora]
MESNKICNGGRTTTTMSETVLGCVMSYIYDPKDRDAVSLVCKRWYEQDALTRKHLTIALCYTTSPERLRRRFPHLESSKLKGKPRAAMFNLIPEDWVVVLWQIRNGYANKLDGKRRGRDSWVDDRSAGQRRGEESATDHHGQRRSGWALAEKKRLGMGRFWASQHRYGWL